MLPSAEVVQVSAMYPRYLGTAAMFSHVDTSATGWSEQHLTQTAKKGARFPHRRLGLCESAKKTRDIFESARGAVLFVDEAYRLYDPTGRPFPGGGRRDRDVINGGRVPQQAGRGLRGLRRADAHVAGSGESGPQVESLGYH